MSFRNDGAQVAQYVYDFDVDGGAIGAIDLVAKAGAPVIPQGAVIKGVTMKIVTAFTSGGSATLAHGTSVDVDGYSGTAVAVASLVDDFVSNGWDAGAALIWDDTNDHPIYIAVNSVADASFQLTIATAAMTAGKAYYMVEYYLPSES